MGCATLSSIASMGSNAKRTIGGFRPVRRTNMQYIACLSTNITLTSSAFEVRLFRIQQTSCTLQPIISTCKGGSPRATTPPTQHTLGYENRSLVRFDG